MARYHSLIGGREDYNLHDIDREPLDLTDVPPTMGTVRAWDQGSEVCPSCGAIVEFEVETDGGGGLIETVSLCACELPPRRRRVPRVLAEGAKEQPTDGYAERIQRAREHAPRPMNLWAMAIEMHERYPDLDGTGRLSDYTQGTALRPRIELLHALADVLGVRGDWLAFGDGPMTDAKEVAHAR